MDHLDSLESESIYILREAFNRIERLGVALERAGEHRNGPHLGGEGNVIAIRGNSRIR